jgi:hypothetical protein
MNKTEATKKLEHYKSIWEKCGIPCFPYEMYGRSGTWYVSYNSALDTSTKEQKELLRKEMDKIDSESKSHGAKS